jgi:hypothetical protein
MAQFRRSIQPTGFRPEQVSEKNVSQLQAYSDRIANALREERDAVITNRNRTADTLEKNARIEESQLARDTDIQEKNIQTKVREQDLLAQQARQDFETKTQASREIFGTLSTLSTSAALKLQEIEVERFKNQAVQDYAEVMTLGDNSPKVKATEAIAKEAQAEQVKAYTEIAKAEAAGTPPVVADRLSKNINELSFGAKVARLHQLQQKFDPYLNEQFMDGTKVYTDEAGNTFTGQQAARDGKRAGIVAAAALKEFMDVNGITGMNAGFLWKSGFLPGLLSSNQSIMNTAEKAEREDYKAKFTTDLEFQLGNLSKAPEGAADAGKSIIESNWPELVRLYGFQGGLDVLQKIYSTTDSKGEPINDLSALSTATLGPNGQTFGEYWGKNRMLAIQKTLKEAKSAAFQAEQAEKQANAIQAYEAIEADLVQQLESANAQEDESIIETARKEIFDKFGYIPPALETRARLVQQQNTRESQEQANIVLEKIRTGQATQGDVMSIADPELRAKVQEQFQKTVFDTNYGPNYKENLKMAEAAAKQIMGDSLEGTGGLEAKRLAQVISKNFSNDYREGLRLYKDPARAEEYALDKMQRDKEAALLNQDKNARYYSVVGPNNQKVFKNVRSLQARTAAQQNAALDTLRQTLQNTGTRALQSPGILGNETELRTLSEANATGQVLKFTPQMKEAAKILGISELEVANEAIAAYNRTNTVKIAPLRLDASLRAVNSARPQTRKLFTDNPTVQRILRGAAEIDQTSLRDPTNLRGGAGNVGAFRAAIIGKESGGNYNAVNPDSGALGIGQVMPDNVGPWTEKYLGRRLTPQQFLKDPKAQDAVINGRFRDMLNDQAAAGYKGEEAIRRAAAVWYSGRGNLWNDTKPQYSNGRRYPSIAEYTKAIYDAYRQQL